jgi:hypothetical protein
MERHRLWSGLHQLIRHRYTTLVYQNPARSGPPYDRYDELDGNGWERTSYLVVDNFTTVHKSIAILIYTSREVLL